VTQRLDAFATVRTGLVLNRFKATDQAPKSVEYQLVGLRCFTDGLVLDRWGLENFLAQEAVPSKYLTRKGDILVRLRAPLKAVYVEEEGLLFSSLTAVIRTDESIVLSEYLTHYLNSHTVQNRLLRSLKGTRIPTVKTSDIAALEVVIPPREKQRTLIGLMDTAEKERQLLQELIDLRKEASRAVFEKIIANYKEP